MSRIETRDSCGCKQRVVHHWATGYVTYYAPCGTYCTLMRERIQERHLTVEQILNQQTSPGGDHKPLKMVFGRFSDTGCFKRFTNDFAPEWFREYPRGG